MKTLKLVIELTYDDEIMHGSEPAGLAWFYSDVLDNEKNKLFLWSNEIGDEVGEVTVLEVL